jgi:predicted protein tyrosine phosphatase
MALYPSDKVMMDGRLNDWVLMSKTVTDVLGAVHRRALVTRHKAPLLEGRVFCIGAAWV